MPEKRSERSDMSPPPATPEHLVGPLPRTVSYDSAEVALIATEAAITKACERALQDPEVTYTKLYGLGIARRALALSAGFRTMVDQRNSLCALPMVRMQLDTVLRLYAGFFVPDHQKFCLDVWNGAEINRMTVDGKQRMTDKYLLDRVATVNPWLPAVYKDMSGHIHFSGRHMREVIRMDSDTAGTLVVGPTDFGREADHYREPARCLHHLNLLLEFALRDWFIRMCRSDGLVPSANEVWSEHGDVEYEEGEGD